MGTPIITPKPPYGTDCPVCTPGLWPAGETPQHVYIYFEGITDCGWSVHPAPNGQTFELDQVDGSPCRWAHDGDVWMVNFHAKRVGFDYSWITLVSEDGYFLFDGTGVTCPPDLAVFDNDMESCILFYGGAGGHAILSYTDIVSWLVAQFGLDAGVNLMHQLFLHPDGDIVHKFCDIRQVTNIKIKYSP